MPFLDRERVRIHYDVVGRGPVILLTHGFADSSSEFAANAEALAEHHTVVTWDLRGHGRSDAPGDPSAYSVPLAVGDMLALLDAAGAETAVLGGHSLGGFLSLELNLAHPELVAGLVLIATGPGYRKPEGREGWNRMAERFAARFEKDDPGLAMVARHVLPQHDARVIDSLPDIAVPTLVVVGGDDEQFTASSRYLAEKIPGAELAVIEGAGHHPHVSHAEQFHQALEAFLTRRAEAAPPRDDGRRGWSPWTFP